MGREHGRSILSDFEEVRVEMPSFAPARVRIALEGRMRRWRRLLRARIQDGQARVCGDPAPVRALGDALHRLARDG